MGILKIKPIDTVFYKEINDIGGSYVEFRNEMLIICYDFYAMERDSEDQLIWTENKKTYWRHHILRRNVACISINRQIHIDVVRWAIKFEGYGLDNYYIYYAKRSEAEETLKRALDWWPTGIDPV
jgi:hypothetical protein